MTAAPPADRPIVVRYGLARNQLLGFSLVASCVLVSLLT
jgi:hypothetical protein